VRYKLRTLLILVALLPPLLWIGWGKYQAWRAEQERQRAASAAQQKFLMDQQHAQRAIAAARARIAAFEAQFAAELAEKVSAMEAEYAARQKAKAGDSSHQEHGKGP